MRSDENYKKRNRSNEPAVEHKPPPNVVTGSARKKRQKPLIEKPSPGDPRVLRVFGNIGGHTADDESAADLLRHECELVRTAYAILLRRRRRLDQFKANMFGEPAWDMLLEIYVREISGSSSTDEQLQLASATAPSTAGRWLQYLETEGLVARCERRLNGGTAFVELTGLGRQALDEYLASILDLAPAASEPSH